MKIEMLLDKLENKLFFSVSELAEILGIKEDSARVFASRYAKKGIFVRLKRDFYVLKQNLNMYNKEQLFKIANFLQVPSYISFMTALEYYGITTQVQRNFFESAALRRSISFESAGLSFNYYKIKRVLYFDFIRINDFFISTKEKAFVDAVYLWSFGKYTIDFDSLDFDKLDKDRLKSVIQPYPEKTKRMVRKLCSI